MLYQGACLVEYAEAEREEERIKALSGRLYLLPLAVLLYLDWFLVSVRKDHQVNALGPNTQNPGFLGLLNLLVFMRDFSSFGLVLGPTLLSLVYILLK